MTTRRAPQPPADSSDRRHFLKSSTAAVVGGTLLAKAPAVHAAGDQVIRVGLIGCGGRGTGAARNALEAGPDVRLVALGDAFDDRARASRENLKKIYGQRVDVPDDRLFVGFDAYQKVIDSGVDVVLLATPPHFRPAHLRAAVEAGKHVFCEKPVAVDAPGVRSVLETAALADKKKLSIVSGLCWRYDARVREAIGRVHDGQIGDIVTLYETYNTGYLWSHPKREGWSDMEWQVRNWLYFTWLSGDFNVEQHVHSIDKGLWALNDAHPIKAVGLGGRQVRTEPVYGHIFDHHAVCYEFENGVRMFSFCRQQRNTAVDVSDYFSGTKGRCTISGSRGTASIEGADPWRSPASAPNMYQVEHDELFNAIRTSTPINNGAYMANSTMVAIMGRMATYTGQEVTWEQAFNSSQRLGPEKYQWGPIEVPPVAVPGVTNIA